MALRAAFMFLAPESNPDLHRALIPTDAVELTVVGVPDYASAERVACQLVDDGIAAIELCGGFGHEGTARIVKAVQGQAVIGVVRFDQHPGLGGKSGDEIFA